MELSPRAVLAGVLLGALLAAGNVYAGLKIGYVDGGAMFAAVVGFAALGWRGYGARENNVTATVAAMAAMGCMAGGLIGPVTALAMLGHDVPLVAVALLALAHGALGIALALALRHELVVRQALPFPSGLATGNLIVTMQEARREGLRRARWLGLGAALAAAVVVPRDILHWIPSDVFVPGGEALLLGLSVSPLLVATGMIMGLRAALTILGGALLAWGVLAPLALRLGEAQPGFGNLVSWTMWPGAGLMIASAMTQLALDARAIATGARELVRAFARARGAWIAAALSVGAATAAAAYAFGAGLGWCLLGVALAVVLGAVCAKVAGETDQTPSGAFGGVAQIAVGGVSRAGPPTSLAAGAAVSGVASVVTVALAAFRAGQRVDANPVKLAVAQVIGLVAGVAASILAYAAVRSALGLGTAALPASAAISWRATAEAVAGGTAGMPRGAMIAGLCGVTLGVALTLCERRFGWRWLPSPTALGLAFIMPASYGVALGLGGILAAMVKREEQVGVVAAGAIAGESLLGVALAAIAALRGG